MPLFCVRNGRKLVAVKDLPEAQEFLQASERLNEWEQQKVARMLALLGEFQADEYPLVFPRFGPLHPTFQRMIDLYNRLKWKLPQIKVRPHGS